MQRWAPGAGSWRCASVRAGSCWAETQPRQKGQEMGEGRAPCWEPGHHTRQLDTPQFFKAEAALGRIFHRDDLSRYSAFPRRLRDVEELEESLSAGCQRGSGLDCGPGRWGGRCSCSLRPRRVNMALEHGTWCICGNERSSAPDKVPACLVLGLSSGGTRTEPPQVLVLRGWL